MWSDWRIRWIVIAGLAAIDAAWLWAGGIGIEVDTLGPRLRIASPFIAGCLISAALLGYLRRHPRPLLVGADFFYSATQFLLLLPCTATLTYLVAMVNAPLADDAFLRADRLLGFDWNAYDAWIAAYPWLSMLLRGAYGSIFVQCLVVMLAGSISRAGERNGEFVWLFAVNLILCSAISAALPALGYEGAIGPAHIEALKELRAGGWTTLNFERIDGIITFPSFHAALAVVFVYSVRRVSYALGFLAPLNVLFLLSTPRVGGHYLVDVIAGVALAVASIGIVHRIRRVTAPATASRPFALGTEVGNAAVLTSEGGAGRP